MAIVLGQIETLKRIRSTLTDEGISGFNSTGDIRAFLKHYDIEKQAVIDRVTSNVDDEIRELKDKWALYQKHYEDLKARKVGNLNQRIKGYKERYDQLGVNNPGNVISSTYATVERKRLRLSNAFLENYFDSIVLLLTAKAQKRLTRVIKTYKDLVSNRDLIIRRLSKPQLEELNRTKRVLEGLNPVIAGAHGENRVSKELQKLSDEYYLINDFSMKLESPVYYPEEKSKISSIQIDHLVVCRAGVFLIETKNWSKKTVNGSQMRSPVKQIRRSSYALYATLTYSNEIESLLNKHHWGKRKIPIKSVIAMINNKPKEKFQYVQVKTLNELNGYISYFKPVFSNHEVKSISNYLQKLQN